MNTYLLDTNVLVALMWPAHEDHARVQSWFGRNSKIEWATCSFTQASVVRILSNPAFSRDAVTPQQALKVLGANLEHPQHQFWSDNIGLIRLVEPVRKRLFGHQQINDAYLVGLAIHHKAKLATMDRAIMALLPDSLRDAVTII